MSKLIIPLGCAFLFALAVGMSRIVLAEPDDESSERHLTIEMLLDRERLGAVFAVSSKDKVYFELLRPASSLEGALPFRLETAHSNARKLIMTVPRDGGKAPAPLFEQEGKSAYWFASARPLSQDGRYWSLVRMRDGRMQPGVFDSTANKAQFFDISLRDGADVPVVQWASGNDLVLLANGAGSETETTFSPVVEGARQRALAREMAWRHRAQSTGSPIGAGRFATKKGRGGTSSRIVVLNVETGATRVLAEGEFWRIEVSPDRMYVAVLEFDHGRATIAASSDTAVLRSEGRQGIAIIEVATAEKRSLQPRGNEQLSHWSWSATSGELILLKRWAIDAEQTEKQFVVLNSLADVTRVLPAGVDQLRWWGEDLLYVEPASERVQGRNWVLSDPDGNSRVLISVDRSESTQLVGGDHQFLYFLDDGELWRISRSGQRQSIEGVANGNLKLCSTLSLLPRRQNTSTDAFGASKLGGLANIRDSVFEYRDGDQRCLTAVMSEGGKLANGHCYVGEAVPMVRDGTDALLVLSNEIGIGSVLDRLSLDQAREVSPLVVFNEHLAAVLPSTNAIRIDHVGPSGEQLFSWLHLPPDIDTDRARRLPVVVTPYAGLVHGDELTESRGSYDGLSIWDVMPVAPTALEVLTGAGYAVLTPSIPLGKRGEAGDPLTMIVPSVTSALDTGIESGLINPDQIAAIGHSYGGFSVLSLAVHTNRFRALIASAPTSNLTNRYGDFIEYMRFAAAEYSFRERTSAWMFEIGQHRMGSAPWEDPERYVRNSPLFFADRVVTPLMLIHGDMDFVGMNQSEQMFTALARQGKDVLFVRYWGEEHTIQQPQNQRDMWNRVFEFLEDNGMTPVPKTVH